MKASQVNWLNPYAKKGKLWVKGNLHTHTDRSGCGRIPPAEVLGIYEKMGYAFLALTDHQRVSDPREHRSRLVLLAGIEANDAAGNHTCIVNTEKRGIDYRPEYTHQQLIDRNIRRGALVVLNHPDWQQREHYPVEALFRLRHYTGIEIYNSVIERLEGASLSTAKWDRLLHENRRVLGFASQDSHIHGDHLDCCNVARVNRVSRESVLEALLTGNFYCHYGVAILDVGRSRNRVHVATANARLIRFIGGGGRVLKKVKGRCADIDFSRHPGCLYVRAECLGVGEQVSWTQPFFKE